MARFSPQAEQTLRRAGWYPGRQVPAMVASWKKDLMLSDGVEMFSSAESVLLEFGGLRIDQQGPGVSCAREPFTFDPTSAVYEGDRFSDFSTVLRTRRRLYHRANWDLLAKAGTYEGDFCPDVLGILPSRTPDFHQCLERVVVTNVGTYLITIKQPL